MPTNDREMPKHETVARSVLKDCVGLSWDDTTATITLTPISFLLCVQAVLSRHCSDLAPAAQGDVAEAMQTVKDMISGGGIHETEVAALETIIAAAKHHPAPENIETFKLPFEVKIGNNSFGKGAPKENLTQNQAAGGADLEKVRGALDDYLRKCDFHGERVLSKPMPTDADIHRFKQALSILTTGANKT